MGKVIRLNFSVLWMCFGVWGGLAGCDNADYSLDKAIPRLQTPVNQIAYFRTNWRNGEHIGTVFYDRENNILESFQFGRWSTKKQYFYNNGRLEKTISYLHGDSDAPGNAGVDTVLFEYDKGLRVMSETHRTGRITTDDSFTNREVYTLFWEYTVAGDTVLKKWEGRYEPLPSTITNVNRWEKDTKKRVTSHYKLYVIEGSLQDTTEHFMRRYLYDSNGRLKMTWFESMYLGRFYQPPGPDTIVYSYDSQGRLAKERHRYTTDMRNKHEVDTTKLSETDRELVRSYRAGFLTGKGYSSKNDRVNNIEYRYETFDPEKHRELEIP